MKLANMLVRLGWCLLTWPALEADTLQLVDGRTVHGTFLRGDSRQIRFEGQDGSTRTYAIHEIQGITFKNSESVAAAPTRHRSTSGQAAAEEPAMRSGIVPAGAVITVRMIDAIDSDATSAGEKFRGSLDDPLVVQGRTVAERGTDVTVQVVRVEQSGRFTGRDEVALELYEISIGGKKRAVASSYAEVASASRGDRTAKVVGGTAAVGAIIGAIAGGGKGAAIGATTGAGAGAAVQAMTKGQRVKIPSESRLDFTLKQPLAIE